MKNKLEHILLSILLGLSVLLGLSFWLNTIFNFNIFYRAHWDELAKLQASHTPINIGFYISFWVAVFIFLIGLYLIYRPVIKNIKIKKIKPTPDTHAPIVVQQTETIKTTDEKQPVATTINMSRPPRLNLPNNMAQIVAQNQTKHEKQEIQVSENPYNSMVSEIFSNNGYLIKPNPVISGFTPNLFAIGNNEVVWIGGIDCDENKIMTAIQKLQSVFQDTLEDIPININAFILDTMNKQNETDGILIFKSIDELKEFINEHPADEISDDEKDSFDSYSEYIDTIIQYIKNI